MNKILIILLLLLFGCSEETKSKRKRSNPESETILVHDTIYIDKVTNLETTQNGQVDTIWKGVDKGWDVKDQGGEPSNTVSFYIVCIDGYQYYIEGKLNMMSPRVIAGPSGYMQPMKCVVRK